MNFPLEKVKLLLNKSGFKATEQRISILNFLLKQKGPVTLKDIEHSLGKGQAHNVTLYRVLSSFKDAGIVKQIDFGDSVPYFEILDPKNDHHHIVCTKCHKIADFVGCGIENLTKKALKQTKDFNQIVNHSIELFGICNKCAKN